MTEIDVPDWVVEAAMAAGEQFASENTVSMYATVRDLRREEMRTSIAAALGALVVPVGRLNDSSPTLFTLRQEKPE